MRAVSNKRYPGLRPTLTAATLVVVLLAVALSTTLVGLTNRLHAASQSLADTVESVNLANGAEIDLLLHARTKDPVARRGLEADLRRTFAALGPFVVTAEEARALWTMSDTVDQYFRAQHDEGASMELREKRLDAAYEALDALVDVNIAHARNARERVARWDTIANGVGLGTALGVLLLAGCFLWWLRARGFRPVFSLLDSMQRFGRGERGVRAEETGPSELYELARRFNEMAAALSAQREVQMSFLAGVVHDLRNPLAALRLATAAARAENRSPPEVRLERIGERLERQTARMERMLGDLLDTVRIEAGKLELRLDLRDARELVREVASSFETASPLHQLVVQVPEDAIWLRCDPLRIEQVLSNLVSNAIKYSPDGGRVTITLRQDAGDAVISVVDCGIGISDDDQSRLFEPFRRVGPSKDAIPGVGLGLFVVRQIVAAHGGRVELTSAPRQGTEIRVRLRVDTSIPAELGGGARPAAPVPAN